MRLKLNWSKGLIEEDSCKSNEQPRVQSWKIQLTSPCDSNELKFCDDEL